MDHVVKQQRSIGYVRFTYSHGSSAATMMTSKSISFLFCLVQCSVQTFVKILFYQHTSECVFSNQLLLCVWFCLLRSEERGSVIS